MNGEHLLRRIRAAQLSQKELADRMGVMPQSVSSMMKSKNVGSDKLEEICKAINKPMNFLYEGYKDDMYTVTPEPIIINSKENDDKNQIIANLFEMLKQKDEDIRRISGDCDSKEQSYKEELKELRSSYEHKLAEKENIIEALRNEYKLLEHQVYDMRPFTKEEYTVGAKQL